MAPPPSDRLSLRLDRALACAGPIGGVALARISMARAYGKAHGQPTGALRAWSLGWGRRQARPAIDPT